MKVRESLYPQKFIPGHIQIAQIKKWTDEIMSLQKPEVYNVITFIWKLG